MCQVKIFNQAGEEVGRFSNDVDENYYRQFGHNWSMYPPNHWGCSVSHCQGFYVLLAIQRGVYASLGVYATEDEAQAAWRELAETVKKYQGQPTPAELPEYHVPRGKNKVDPYLVYRALSNR